LYLAKDDDDNEGRRRRRPNGVIEGSSRDDETGMESDGTEIDKEEAHFLEENGKYDNI
jgi:hypothetical protein